MGGARHSQQTVVHHVLPSMLWPTMATCTFSTSLSKWPQTNVALRSPRDGKNIGFFDLLWGLKECYNLSTPLAIVLSLGNYILLKTVRRVSLYEIGAHGKIEHDASLVHEDTPAGEEFAPIKIHPEWVDQLIADVKTRKEEGEGPDAGNKRTLMDAEDVARARVRREKLSSPLDGLHAEIARGEMAIALGMWEVQVGGNKGVPVEWIREWIRDEKMPKDSKPVKVQGLLNTVKRSKEIRTAMANMRKAEAEANAKTDVKPKEKTVESEKTKKE